MTIGKSDQYKKTLGYRSDIEQASLIVMVINIFIERRMNNQWLINDIF